jgi:16S rRNA processing protein RimM
MPDSTSTDKKRRQPKRSYQPPTLAGTRGPQPGTPLEQVELVVGAIVGTHGLYGEVRVRLYTDDPEHLTGLDHLLVGEKRTPYAVESIRFHKGMALIQFAGVDDVDAAEALRGAVIRISGADARPLEENEFYLYQVVGLEVRAESGEAIGTVTDVIETGANMVFVVTPPDGGKEELFPSIPEVVLDIQPAEGYMVVRRQQFWGEDQDSPPAT